MLAKKATAKEKQEKKNWYADRYQYVVVQRNMLAVITAVSLLAALISAFSISQLAPLKSVEPFVIQVDQKSGITQVVDPLTATDFYGNESVNQYFMVQYVRARETFSGKVDYNNYNAVRLMSDPTTVFNDYMWEINPNNKEGYVGKLSTQPGMLRTIKIGNITLLDVTTDPADAMTVRRYQVRLAITERSPRAQQGTTIYKVVTIAFKYLDLNLSIEDRYLNPIGFRVVDYRVDEDTLAK